MLVSKDTFSLESTTISLAPSSPMCSTTERSYTCGHDLSEVNEPKCMYYPRCVAVAATRLNYSGVCLPCRAAAAAERAAAELAAAEAARQQINADERTRQEFRAQAESDAAVQARERYQEWLKRNNQQ